MSTQILTSLAWLPPAPADFNQQLKSVTPDGAALRALATHNLNTSQLTNLARAVVRLKKEGADLKPLTPLKLGIIGNATTEIFTPALQAAALRHGIDLSVYEAPFNTMVPETLNPGSQLHQENCDAVFFALDYRGLPLSPSPGDEAAAGQSVNESLQQLDAMREAVHQAGTPVCILQTLAPPIEHAFGGFERQLAGTTRHQIDAFNHGLRSRAANSGDIVFDAAFLAETVGLAQWHDPVIWNMSKLPFAQSLIPLYVDHLARLLGALRSKSRRVLVLDLDNTVWGGIIGDDGLEGIKIGNGSALGEAHLHLQHTALALRERGIVLAVCSKNNDDTARLPFREHPDMLLKEEHISVFQANWTDKATNLQAIAQHLSLGLDSLVFLDDNPAERARVRQMLPEVAVPELPEDPALYARTLMAAGYFETIGFSDEDKKRADYYRGNAERLSLQSKLGNYDEYLKSLDMTLRFSPFDAQGRARITQLINKSNQFNLTTRRYSEAEISALEQDGNVFTLQARLQDRFGDNGMIETIICRYTAPDTWDIDTWLMSCRVLGRSVEAATLAELAHHAKHRGIRVLTGRYIPTDRNKLVIEHYAKLGFEKTGEIEGGETLWKLDLSSYQPPSLPLVIERDGFETERTAAA